MSETSAKIETQRQWNANPCGAQTAGSVERGSPAFFHGVEQHRYEVYAPWLKAAVDFGSFSGQTVLEIGPGLGTDHVQFARAGAHAFAIDLTQTHLELTRQRLGHDGYTPRLVRADAEVLPFANDCFDAVYSFGVLHHTPDTRRAVDEAWRVLKPGGRAVVSLYHRHSAFHWIATVLCRGIRRGELLTRGYRRMLADIEQGARESGATPLVKVLSRRQCRRLFAGFRDVVVRSDHVDLMHVFPRLSPSPLTRRLRVEKLAGRWGWYLTVFARK